MHTKHTRSLFLLLMSRHFIQQVTPSAMYITANAISPHILLYQKITLAPELQPLKHR